MSNILSRIQEIACKEGITIGALERNIGASQGVLSRAIANGTDIQSKWIGIIVENYPQYSTRWLLTGEGPILRADSVPISPSPLSTDSPMASDAIVLRLMEKIDEKDIKIDHLQSDLRQKSEELAALKAKYNQFQDKEPESPPLSMPGTAEDFIGNSYGDYGEGYPHTKEPTSLKKSSGGKI